MVYYDRLDIRVLILTIPSLVVLGLLVLHSFRTLPRTRAVAFWSVTTGYGIVRGFALAFVTDHVEGASFPYAIRNPLFPILGVPLQEIAGWAIVVYLGWWLGSRFSLRVFPQLAWAFVFLGAISWAVESAAVAAGWWRWSLPVNLPFFINVPFIAIVDWAFVAIDVLLPFVVFTAPALRGRSIRFAALLAFPLHFGSHCLAGASAAGIPIHHFVHWTLLLSVVWLAMRSPVVDGPFIRGGDWMPISGLAVILMDAAAVELFMVEEPRLLVSILPALALGLWALRPRLAAMTRPRGRSMAIAVVSLLAVYAYVVHSQAARNERNLMRGLSVALASRDRGDLNAARRELSALADAHPGSHVPSSLLGEIDYKTGRLEAARALFLRVVEIKQDDARSYRYLAVIDRRLGRTESARGFASTGLEIEAGDPELLYLSGREPEPSDASTALVLASLAFEVEDVDFAVAMLDRGLALWPEERSFYPIRVKLALQGGDAATARRVVAAWRDRFPQDAEARQLFKQLGME